MTQLFQAHTDEDQTQALANLLPVGRVFASKNIDDSNFRQLLRVFAPEMSRFEQTYLEVSKETDINDADVYLQSWEKALGIPDDCFPATGDIEERRLHVIVKLGCMNIATRQDFIDLAAKLGKTITITSLEAISLPPYDIPMTPSGAPEFRFIWVVSGENIVPSVPPLDIPHFLDVGSSVLFCTFEKLKPAMTEIIFVNS